MDPARVLGLDSGATKEEVRVAFRRLALLRHPDRPGGSEAAFKELVAAYQALLDGHCPGRAAAGGRRGAAGFHSAYAGQQYASRQHGHGHAGGAPRRAPGADFYRAFKSSGSMLATAALGGVGLLGLLLLEPALGAAWERHNEGKLFSSLEAERARGRREQRRRRSQDPLQ